MVASPPWRRGCQVRAPLRHGAMGPLMSWDPWPRPVARAVVGAQARAVVGAQARAVVGAQARAVVGAQARAAVGAQARAVVGAQARAVVGVQKSVHRSAKMALRSRFGAFVYTVATRAASGSTSAPTAMACRQRPSVARLFPGRKNRLCASGAAARLAFSLRCQLTQTPEEPLKKHRVRQSYFDSGDVVGRSQADVVLPNLSRFVLTFKRVWTILWIAEIRQPDFGS